MESPGMELRTPLSRQKGPVEQGPDSGYGTDRAEASSSPQPCEDSQEIDAEVVRQLEPEFSCCSSPASEAAVPQSEERPAEGPSPAGDSGPPRKDTCSCGLNSKVKVWHGLIYMLLLVLVAVGSIMAMVLLKGTPSVVWQCAEDWIGFNGKCYYFSTNTMSWKASKEYCISHGSTLPVIKEEQQLENIKRLRETYYYWIGLQKEAEIWQWVDGSLFNNKVIPLENEDPDLNCAFLNDDKLITIDCTSSRHWICVKEFS
ncbi:C-type lectin domain family 2 member D-like [Pelodiscus sinensis]|uniref:C-type lectin domain family 2 member D-like n=1 Tax=Pelodiscus sinensis TaxID=13735 RepID=UPI0003C4B99C|nr:C-type lectin domain family 2 member B-like isoform X1 [Pelodiscus sinensis]XP_006138066.1 C-type lectin domain family 2 member B-like isoform X2 [Pelodiscus sinensis]|eukprot:XP_006138065.1 C-type lectin domain family 2 member B-like isoform X1 [Pelodiscus sinensis]